MGQVLCTTSSSLPRCGFLKKKERRERRWIWYCNFFTSLAWRAREPCGSPRLHHYERLVVVCVMHLWLAFLLLILSSFFAALLLGLCHLYTIINFFLSSPLLLPYLLSFSSSSLYTFANMRCALLDCLLQCRLLIVLRTHRPLLPLLLRSVLISFLLFLVLTCCP